MNVDTDGIRLDKRIVSFPRSISEAAQSAIRMLVNADGIPLNMLLPSPSQEDVQGWLDFRSVACTFFAGELQDATKAAASSVETIDIGRAVVHVATPAVERYTGCAMINLDGGMLLTGGGTPCKASAQRQADLHGVTCYGIDYRMPPEHPFPAALDDCLTAYRHVMARHSPERVVVSGRSAGGNLAVATLLRARDEGWPMPRALVLLSPQLDLTESGDSFEVNRGIDVVLPRSLIACNLLYSGGVDLTHRYVSPLFGSYEGFPPTFLQSGTRDLFLSNAVRMHRQLRRSCIATELHVFEAMPHGGFGGATPEDRELNDEIIRFVAERWSAHRVSQATEGPLIDE